MYLYTCVLAVHVFVLVLTYTNVLTHVCEKACVLCASPILIEGIWEGRKVIVQGVLLKEVSD